MQEFFNTSVLQLQILGQVALAMFLGALIGLDREIARKPAGLRTQMLVAGAATLIVRLAEIMVTHFAALTISELLRADPIRIFVAVVTGISFLGAGTIIRQNRENSVEGLTTAASLLFSSVIGISVGLSQYVLAIGATLLAIMTLVLLGYLGKKIKKNFSENENE